MSLVSKKKPLTPASPPHDVRPDKETAAHPRQKRRCLPKLAVIPLGFVAMIALLPTILVHTPLIAYLVRRATNLDGTIQIQSASIGWFAPTSVSGVVIADAHGETILEADRLTCDRSLMKLLLHRADFGALRIEKPRLTARLTHEGSNIESLLARWRTAPTASPQPDSPPPSSASSSTSAAADLTLQVDDGEVAIIDEQTQQSWNVPGLQLAIDLRMSRQPVEFCLSAGTLGSHVQLDQAACRSALKYVVPILASVTQSQGEISVLIDGCRIPAGDWNHAEIAGRIIVHSAAVRPGPLVQELASLVATDPSLVHIEPESTIQFRMTGGRIYHQGLALQFPDVTMRTYGSVGLDDSLKLMVETSLPLSWLPSNAVTDAIRGQRIQIPVGGTLQRPQPDMGELARERDQVLGNLARGALQSGVIQRGVGSALNRLIQQQR
jgi:hypothetical protein